MSKKKTPNAADYIKPLYIDGMHGRMLRMPAPKDKTREILFIYGHHSTLERWWGVIQDLNQYGAVTVPDLPGFGGMDSFYKIGETPTIDNLADYLASFIKLFYKRRRLTITGLSFGFVVVTRMLQRYPEIAKKVDLVVSVVGFAHRDDFAFGTPRHQLYLLGAKAFDGKWSSKLFRGLFLNKPVLRAVYARTPNAKRKFVGKSPEAFKETMDFEIVLWHKNDVRTHWYTVNEFLQLNNCTKQVDLQVWHISAKADKYFNNHMVEQHYRVIFTDFHEAKARMNDHGPSVIASKKEAAALLPQKIRRILSES
jgi:pimeloyl-ACP methyl ester carboxylesterase